MTILLSILLAMIIETPIPGVSEHIYLDEILPTEQPPIGPMIEIEALSERQRWKI